MQGVLYDGKRIFLLGSELIILSIYLTVLLKGVLAMIKLTKFNSEVQKKGEFVLNAEIIETIEETPDTVITLTNGKKLIVDESMDDIVRRVMAYRRALHKF